MPDCMITPDIVLSSRAALKDRPSVPILTADTVLLPAPPKNPVPEISIVTDKLFILVLRLRLLTVGAGVVTVNLSVDEVILVPPSAVTDKS